MYGHADGSVTVGNTRYPDIASYHRSSAFRDSGARCGTIEPPVSFAMPADCNSAGTTILGEYGPGLDFTIPVVFHAITSSTGDGYVSDELIHSQMAILNEDFQALLGTPGEAGTESRIRFELATVDPTGEPTAGILRYADDEYFVNGFNTQRDLHWDTRRYLNIYSTNPGAILGYATSPWDAAGEDHDGVILGWRYIGRDAPDGGVYNQGRTMTHEVGHYLGLLHTFHNGCGSSTQPYSTGDLIADTRAEQSESYGCEEMDSACGSGPRPIHNYMNYSDDTCMTHFTPEQINRMRCALHNYRDGLVNDLPVADFLVAAEGRTVRFTSLATDNDGSVVGLEWDFGDGATSTEANPIHTYAAYGRYEVVFTVTDDFGSRTTGAAWILANDLPTADFSVCGDGLSVRFTDRSDDSNGPVVAWNWNFGDGSSASDAEPRHVYAMAGSYTVELTVTDSDGGEATATAEVVVPIAGGCAIASGWSGTHGSRGGRSWTVVLVFGLVILCVYRRRYDFAVGVEQRPC